MLESAEVSLSFRGLITLWDGCFRQSSVLFRPGNNNRTESTQEIQGFYCVLSMCNGHCVRSKDGCTWSLVPSGQYRLTEKQNSLFYPLLSFNFLFGDCAGKLNKSLKKQLISIWKKKPAWATPHTMNENRFQMDPRFIHFTKQTTKWICSLDLHNKLVPNLAALDKHLLSQLLWARNLRVT